MLELTAKDRNALLKIVEDDSLCEAFAEVVLEQIDSDDLKLESKGRQLAAHLLANSAPDVLMDLCGWTVETLYAKAVEKTKEENKDD